MLEGGMSKYVSLVKTLIFEAPLNPPEGGKRPHFLIFPPFGGIKG